MRFRSAPSTEGPVRDCAPSAGLAAGLALSLLCAGAPSAHDGTRASHAHIEKNGHLDAQNKDGKHLGEECRWVQPYSKDHPFDSTGEITETTAQMVQIVDGTHSSVVVHGVATMGFNCMGYAFQNVRGTGQVYVTITDASLTTLLADGIGLTDTAPKMRGDICVYRSGGKPVHVAVISEVIGGTPLRVTSKWGGWGTASHAPNDVPPSYKEKDGTVSSTYFRLPPDQQPPLN